MNDGMNWTRLGTFDADYEFDGAYGLHRWIDDDGASQYIVVYSSNGQPVSEREHDELDDAIRELRFIESIGAGVDE